MIEIPTWYVWLVVLSLAGGIAVNLWQITDATYPRSKGYASPIEDAIGLALRVAFLGLWLYWWHR
jgi:hypothetical protein